MGYEDGCVYVTLEDGHNTTGSIMFSRLKVDQVSTIISPLPEKHYSKIILLFSSFFKHSQTHSDLMTPKAYNLLLYTLIIIMVLSKDGIEE